MAASNTGGMTKRTLLLMLVLIIPAGSASAYPRPGETDLVSLANDGSLGNVAWSTASEWPALTPDARLVAFHSSASNLVLGDTNERADIFLRDRDRGTTTRLSVASDGTEGSHDSWAPRITPDGRYVAFESWASSLWPGDEGWADVFVHDRLTGFTTRISNAAGGGNGDEGSFAPAISDDGRWVAFDSEAGNLVAGDSNGAVDVFLHDRQMGTTSIISRSSQGVQGEAFSAYPSVSADGRFIAFNSRAVTLVTPDTNNTYDNYVHDRVTGQTTMVSLASDGSQGNGPSFGPRISADGRYVAFGSEATDLVPSDANGGAWDVFVHDRQTGETRQVSVSSDGEQGNDFSAITAFSPDGRYVQFWSDATNLVPGDTNGQRDVFLHDLETGATELISVAVDAAGGNEMSWGIGSVTPGGRHVGFMSVASNIVPGDTNGGADVFVRDRGPALGLRSVSVTDEPGGPRVSGEATFSGARVATATDAPGDAVGPAAASGDLTGVSLTYRPELGSLLARLQLAALPSADAPCYLGCLPAGSPGVLYGLELTAGGVRYEVRALTASAGAVPPETPYVGLYRCAPTCTEIAKLEGGIGSVGREVTFGIPLAAIGAAEGDTLTALRATTSLGEASTGALQPGDEAAVPSVEIPRRSVGLGIGEGSEPPAAFGTPAPLSQGAFSATVPGAAGRPVWARACLGSACSVIRVR